jgi:hypothetical protein
MAEVANATSAVSNYMAVAAIWILFGFAVSALGNAMLSTPAL